MWMSNILRLAYACKVVYSSKLCYNGTMCSSEEESVREGCLHIWGVGGHYVIISVSQLEHLQSFALIPWAMYLYFGVGIVLDESKVLGIFHREGISNDGVVRSVAVVACREKVA